MKRLIVILPAEIHHRFKTLCVEQGTDMSEVIRMLIEGYMKKADKKRRKKKR